MLIIHTGLQPHKLWYTFPVLAPKLCMDGTLIMKIVISGSIAYDYLMRFPGRFRDHLVADKLDRVSLSFLVNDLTRQRGGSGANIAFNLALLGEHPILMGTAGMEFGEYRDWLDRAGVDT